MGQKVHPIGFRLGYTKGWDAAWFTKQGYTANVIEDLSIRQFLKEKLKKSGISKVEIERVASKLKVGIYTSRPGVLIGKKGAGIDVLRKEISDHISKDVILNIHEVKKAETDAQLIAENIAFQLEKRVGFRRAMKRAMQQAIKLGVDGIKVKVSGRLGGAEMARTEAYMEGRVPLHTLRADINYGTYEALTTYGIIGVKVWVNKGEILKK